MSDSTSSTDNLSILRRGSEAAAEMFARLVADGQADNVAAAEDVGNVDLGLVLIGGVIGAGHVSHAPYDYRGKCRKCQIPLCTHDDCSYIETR